MLLWITIMFGAAVAAAGVYLWQTVYKKTPARHSSAPESYVVHHEGKAHGMDIAGAALRARTKDLRRDAPGSGTGPIKIPGRAAVTVGQPENPTTERAPD